MDREQILALFDKELRVEVEYPDMRKEVLSHVVRFVRPAPGMSFVLYSKLDEENADEVIREQVEYFSAGGHPFEWKVYEHDTPADLRKRVVAQGFEPEERDAVMVLDVQAAPAALLAPIEADVRRLTEPAQLADVIRVEEQVWGENFDWIHERMGGHMAIPGYLSVYVAYVEGEPACTGWTFFHEGSHFASLWGGSTAPAYRKRGLYTALLAARVQEARERGVRFLVIDASPMSRPIVERHGFHLLTYAHACEWKG